MEFLRGKENEEIRSKVFLLIQNFDEQFRDFEEEDTSLWKEQIIKAQGIKNKRSIIRKLMEVNLPACAKLLDDLIEESANNIFEYLEYMSARQIVAMSVESFVCAQKLAEKAHSEAKKLYDSMKGKYFNPAVATQDVYNAYFGCCLDLFIVSRYQGRLENAKQYLEEAKKIAHEANQQNDLHKVHILEGELCLAKGLLNTAISEFFTPLLNKESLTDENKGLLLQKLGNACRSAAQWGPAKSHLRKSIQIARSLSDKISEYDRITDLGNVYRSEGRTADAIRMQDSHMKFAVSRGDQWGLTVACFNLGFTFFSINPTPDLERAQFFLAAKYDFAARSCNEVLRGMALNNLGKLFCAQGQYDSAVEVMKQCVEISKKTGNVAGEGMAYGNLGTAYRALGRLDDAIKHHEMYRQNAIGRGDDGGVAIMQRELAWDYLLKKDFENAEEQAKNSILTSELIRQKLGTEDSSKLANFDKNQAEAYNLLQVSLIHQSKIAEALAFSEFARARAITDIIRDRSTRKGNSWQWKDDIFTRQESFQSLADSIISDFFKTADELDTNFLVYSVVTDYHVKEKKEQYLYIWLVKCCKDLGADDNRISFARVKLEHQIHGNLVADERFFTSLTRSFQQMNIHKTGSDETTPTKKDQKVDKDDGEEDEIDLVIPDGKYIERLVQIVRSLTLKSPSLSRSAEGFRKGEPKSEDEVKVNTRNDTSFDESEKSIEVIRYVDYGSWDTEGFKQLSLLYNICLAPIEGSLPCVSGNHVPRIIIIPQEFLFSVPFCALYNPVKKQYFIEHCILSYAPSLRALHHLQLRLKELRASQGGRKLKLLAAGDPKFDHQHNLHELPKAGVEAQHVRHVFGSEQCQVALADQAKKSLVINEMKNIDVLHLATHACPDNASPENTGRNYLMQGALYLSPSNDECDGVLEAWEIAKTLCNCQLVLLSCCETGLGELTGDGVLGLYRAFFASGAACILVTLWKIRDDVMPLFMEKFYSAFKDLEDVPVALREAMIFYLREKQYPPHEWAAFSVVGASLGRRKNVN